MISVLSVGHQMVSLMSGIEFILWELETSSFQLHLPPKKR